MGVFAPAPLIGADLTASLIEDLAAHGWAHAPGALDPELVTALRLGAEAIDDAGATHAGRVGRGAVDPLQ